MKYLVLCDDIWHPAQVPKDGLAGLKKFGFEFDWIEHADDWSAERMSEYSAVILTKSNNISSADEAPWMSEKTQQSFRDYVHSGNGLVVLHSGTAGYRQTLILRELMGGVFTEHPEQCPVTMEPLFPHPLTIGSSSFSLVDEHYQMEFDDEQADIFMLTKSKHGTQPGGWTRTAGQGRVCVLTPGHNLDVWLHPSYQTILYNVLSWC